MDRTDKVASGSLHSRRRRPPRLLSEGFHQFAVSARATESLASSFQTDETCLPLGQTYVRSPISLIGMKSLRRTSPPRVRRPNSASLLGPNRCLSPTKRQRATPDRAIFALSSPTGFGRNRRSDDAKNGHW